jgi:hypothetical protein
MEVIELPKIGSRKRARRTRSAVTSGRKLFVVGDSNSAWARRYHDLAARHAVDLGGPDELSEAPRSLIRRASAIECELERLEGRLSLGQSIDLDCFTRTASHLRRIFETLGVERKPRDVTPKLSTYLAQKDPPAFAAGNGAPMDIRRDEKVLEGS